MCSGTSHPAPPNQERRASHLPLVAFDSRVPQDPAVQRGQGATGLLFEGAKGVRVQLQRQRQLRQRGWEARPGIRAPMTPTSAGCGWAHRNSAVPGSACAGSEDPVPGEVGGPRSPPAHRHGRRVQREALVVVVPGPVQRVLQLRPRTPLGLADPLLALVVHPAGSPAGSATTSAHTLPATKARPLSGPGGGSTETPFTLARRL